MNPRISSLLFYSTDGVRFHIVIQRALNTEKKEKFEVAGSIR